MKNLAILTTAIIDEQCAIASKNSLLNYLIKPNPNIDFFHFIHLDNHKRNNKRYVGNLESCYKIWHDADEQKNLVSKIMIANPRRGIIAAAYLLFCEFLKYNIDYCLIYEDDTTLKNILNLFDVEKTIESNYDLIHLSFAVINKNGNSGCVDEFFLENNTVKKYGNLLSYERFFNEKKGLSWNGTFFHRTIIEKIVKKYNYLGWSEALYPEDQITKIIVSDKDFDKLKLKTLFYNKEFSLPDDDNWKSSISQDKHIIFDEIRWEGGRDRALF